jgi:hypothetical protein
MLFGRDAGNTIWRVSKCKMKRLSSGKGLTYVLREMRGGKLKKMELMPAGYSRSHWTGLNGAICCYGYEFRICQFTHGLLQKCPYEIDKERNLHVVCKCRVSLAGTGDGVVRCVQPCRWMGQCVGEG